MKQVYISEPKVATTKVIAAKFKDSGYQIKEGDTSFSGGPLSKVEVLIIRSGSRVDATVLESFPNLKAIVRIGVGLDNVDLDFCKQHKISVFNAPGANAPAVAEYVLAMILFVRRKFHLLDAQEIRAWNRFKFTGRDLTNQTVGIIGFGNIGRAVQGRLANLGCTRILAYDPYVTQAQVRARDVTMTTLEELLAKSDTVTLHVPLTSETAYLVDASRLASLKDGALLINASRGGVVDEKALLKIIDQKQLTFVVDTVENEPKVNSALLAHPRVIVTPHIAGLTEEIELNTVRVALDNFLGGRTYEVVNNKYPR